jgi:hypothetical protein
MGKQPIMDEEDLIAEKQSVINKLLASIRKHREDCPDHDIRVLDQTLWSVVDTHEMLSNGNTPQDSAPTT